MGHIFFCEIFQYNTYKHSNSLLSTRTNDFRLGYGQKHPQFLMILDRGFLYQTMQKCLDLFYKLYLDFMDCFWGEIS